MKSILLSLALICSCTCSKDYGRITGGANARAREFPYTVSLRTRDLDNLGHFCGGAIISPSLILTAGACVDQRGPSIHEIVAGTLYRSEPFPGQQVREPVLIVPHPGYQIPPYDDIALILVNEPFIFNENVSAIALPQTNQETYPNPVTINGWGAEQYGLPLSDVLKRVTLDTYSDEYCATFQNQTVPASLLCAGVDEGGIGACLGDAGAPVVTTNGNIYLAGVMSHFPCVEDCCGFPGPWEHSPEISFYVDWITQQSKLLGVGL